MAQIASRGRPIASAQSCQSQRSKHFRVSRPEKSDVLQIRDRASAIASYHLVPSEKHPGIRFVCTKRHSSPQQSDAQADLSATLVPYGPAHEKFLAFRQARGKRVRE